MAIHEQLPRQIHPNLTAMGWTKARELAKIARREGQGFDCAPWVHKASTMPQEEFKREVEKHLPGKDTEPWELLYFKGYKSQLAGIEEAVETASFISGGQKARGYCLEMICADFLAGAGLEDSDGNTLSNSIRRLLDLLPERERRELLGSLRENNHDVSPATASEN
jgi:hypothetical protein